MSSDSYEENFKLFENWQKDGFRKGQLLGEGTEGSVRLIKIKDKKYAVKISNVTIDDEYLHISALPEIVNLMSIQHPYITRAYEVKIYQENSYIFMNVMDGDLENYLRNNELNFKNKKRFIYQLGIALDHISKSGYVHCDVKPPNILIKNENIKLADLGLLRVQEHISPRDCQTYEYKAPELMEIKNDEFYYYRKMLKNRKINHDDIKLDHGKSELWTYGINCLIILYNKYDITFDHIKIYKSVYGKEIIEQRVKRGIEAKSPYDVLLEIFSKKYFYSIYEIITDIYGKLKNPEEDKLVKIVCKYFLNFIPNKRVNYQIFLDMNLFDDVRNIFVQNLPILNNDRILSLPTNRIYTAENLDTTTEWIFEVAEDFNFPVYVTFDSVDFFLQYIDKYISKKQDLQLFAIVSMYIVCHINNYNIDIDSFVSISNDSYTHKKIINKIIEVINTENGKLRVIGIYKFLPKISLLQNARKIITNYRNYVSQGGPRGLASNILDNNN